MLSILRLGYPSFKFNKNHKGHQLSSIYYKEQLARMTGEAYLRTLEIMQFWDLELDDIIGYKFISVS